MTENVVYTEALSEFLLELIPTEKVRVNESNGIIQLIPIQEDFDCTAGLRGILADYDDMSVDKFLARGRADKELDL